MATQQRGLLISPFLQRLCERYDLHPAAALSILTSRTLQDDELDLTPEEIERAKRIAEPQGEKGYGWNYR